MLHTQHTHRWMNMTTNDLDPVTETGAGVAKLEANLARVEELTQRLLKVMGQSRKVAPSLQGPSQELYVKAASASGLVGRKLVGLIISTICWLK